MWAIYNHDSGEWFDGAAWGPIARAATEATKYDADIRYRDLAARTRTSAGTAPGYDETEAVEVEEGSHVKCGHLAPADDMRWVQTARQTWSSPAERETVCPDCWPRFDPERIAAERDEYLERQRESYLEHLADAARGRA